MIEILPAILAHSEEEFIEKVNRVKSLGATLHIDVMDGNFVKNTTWAPSDRVRHLLADVPYEVHLMVSNPEHAVPVWFACGAKRVIYHVESTLRDDLLFRAMHERSSDLSIALNPDTPISRITPLISTFTHVMIMGVKPGWSGQSFQEVAEEKIKALKDLRPSLIIAVDGGIKLENAKSLAKAGANILIVGSALTDQHDPQKTFSQFKKIVAPFDNEL